MSVSYTHLDVYKRQDEGCVDSAQPLVFQPAVQYAADKTVSRQFKGHGNGARIGAVSYTHLDVYKRQV